MTIDDLKDLVIAEYDPDDVIDALQITTEDLVNAFEEKLEDNAHKFMEFAEDE